MGNSFKCSCNIFAMSESGGIAKVPRSQLTEYLSAEVTSEAEEEPLLELGPEDILLLFIMMQNSL